MTWFLTRILGMLIRGSKELWTATLKLALVVDLLKANDTIDWRQPYNVAPGMVMNLDIKS